MWTENLNLPRWMALRRREDGVWKLRIHLPYRYVRNYTQRNNMNMQLIEIQVTSITIKCLIGRSLESSTTYCVACFQKTSMSKIDNIYTISIFQIFKCTHVVDNTHSKCSDSFEYISFRLHKIPFKCLFLPQTSSIGLPFTMYTKITIYYGYNIYEKLK